MTLRPELAELPTPRRLFWLACLPVIGLAAIFIIDAVQLRNDMMATREQLLRTIVEAVHGVVERLDDEVRQGRLSEGDAKAQALATIGRIRYGQMDYLWVNDLGTPNPRMLIHPSIPSLNGTVLEAPAYNVATTFRPEGATTDQKVDRANLFTTMVALVNQSGAGFVSYQWPKPVAEGGSTAEQFHKISYVKAFAPWGWMIGSGLYVDDVEAAYRGKLAQHGAILAAVVAAIGLLAFTITRGITASLSARRRAERNLANSQALTQALIDASSDATILFTPNGTLLALNAVLAQRFGRTVAELIGTNIWDLFPPEVSEPRRQAVAKVVASGRALHFEDYRGDNYFDNSIYPVIDVDGRVDKVAVFSRDITEQITSRTQISRYIAEIERSNAELGRSNAELEQFAYVASHDLREPLRTIASYLSLFERRYGGGLDQDGLQFLDYARNGAVRLDSLVLDLLEFSRVQSTGAPIVEMELADALAVAQHNLSAAIAKSGARVAVDEPLPMVMGDFNQIVQLLQNLIGNAILYRSPDLAPDIHVGCRQQDAEWEFSITDNGIGIEEQYHERIFLIFQRLHGHDAYEGTGIGLAVCKKIVERHGGRIGVKSSAGKGASFCFTLRAPKCACTPEIPRQADTLLAAPPPTARQARVKHA